MTDPPQPPPAAPPASGQLQLTLNGEARPSPAGTSIADLLAASRLAPDKVAVEVNRRLVRTADYGRGLLNGDTVEIVTFVGGG